MEKGFVKLNINTLVKADWNYKQENEFLQEKLVNNIKKNGQIENLIVRDISNGRFEVVNGNHRYDALKELGIESVQVFNLGTISDKDAKRIAIETNESKFESDEIELSELLKELADTTPIKDMLDTMPFTEVELTGLIDQTNFDWNSLKPKKVEKEDKPKPLQIETTEDTKALFHKLRKECDGGMEPSTFFERLLEVFLANRPEENHTEPEGEIVPHT